MARPAHAPPHQAHRHRAPRLAARRWPTHRRGDHRGGPELLRGVHRLHGRDHPRRGRAGAGWFPLARRAVAGGGAVPDRGGGRRRLPARPGRGAQRPVGRRAALGVPDRGAGGLARDVHDRGARRAWTPRTSGASPSWSSPTSTSCRPPAWRATATSWRPPAGCASGCWSGWPSSCSPGSTPTRRRVRPRRPTGRCRRTLTAVLVPDSQVRGVLASLPAGDAAGRRARRPCTARRAWRCCWCRTCTTTAAAALLRALEHRSRRRGSGAALAGGAGLLERAVRVRELGRGPDSEEHLAELVLSADPVALDDLRARVLAPLLELRSRQRGEARRDAALLAAAPGPPRRRRGRPVRARPDRALPHDAAARAPRRPARRPAGRARADRRARHAGRRAVGRRRVGTHPPPPERRTPPTARSGRGRPRPRWRRSGRRAAPWPARAGCPGGQRVGVEQRQVGRGARRRRCPRPSVLAASASATVRCCSGCHGVRSSALRWTAAAIASHGSSGETGASLPSTTSTPSSTKPAQREAALGAVGPELSVRSRSSSRWAGCTLARIPERAIGASPRAAPAGRARSTRGPRSPRTPSSACHTAASPMACTATSRPLRPGVVERVVQALAGDVGGPGAAALAYSRQHQAVRVFRDPSEMIFSGPIVTSGAAAGQRLAGAACPAARNSSSVSTYAPTRTRSSSARRPRRVGPGAEATGRTRGPPAR